jgi:two-component sensor histidine kinase
MIVPAFARLSTGAKMLVILSAALLPLGMIALFTSLGSAHANRLNRDAEARLMAMASAHQLDSAIDAPAAMLRGTLADFGPRIPDRATCERALAALAARAKPTARFALFDGRARKVCATPGFSRAPVRLPTPHIGTEVRIVQNPAILRFSLEGEGMFAVGELARTTVIAASRPLTPSGHYGIVLRQGNIALGLGQLDEGGPLSGVVKVTAPVANGQLSLEMTATASPIGALEVLMVVLPLLMWLAAAVIGWLVVDRLLLRPLSQMQRAITSYRIGGGPMRIPAMTTPAREIRSLGHAFRMVTQKVAAHEAELKEGLARQTRLTREVHHRVKNNLQVVSSLISLHARGARGAEAAAAYATIQRRVDALAVVHRNRTELEESRGVPLRPLIGELTSNLRASVAPETANMAITLEVTPAFVSQDTAVSVAFLITELIELAMFRDPDGAVKISLKPGKAAGWAELSLTATGLAGDMAEPPSARPVFARVLEGLARQLRAPLQHDDAGRYTISIRTLPHAF